MNTCVRRSAVVVLLTLSAACGSSKPTSPTGTSQPPAAPLPTPPRPDFPPLSGPSRTFFFDRELSYPVSDYTKKSRFVLYDNGAFVLQYRFLLYTNMHPKTGPDLSVLPLDGDRKPFVFLSTRFDERVGQFSPDGRWVAYQSNESGRNEVFVRPFPG